MKVTLAPVGSQGDVRPMLALGLALREAGHEVVVAGPPDSEALFASRGFPFFGAGSDLVALTQEEGRRYVGKPLTGFRVLLDILREEVTRQFQDVPPAIEGADVVLGAGVMIAAQHLAEAQGVPYRHVFHVPQTLASAHHAPSSVPWQRLPRLLNRLCWRGFLAASERALGGCVNAQRAALGLQPLEGVYRRLTSRVLIAVDSELAPVPPDVRGDWIQTGYWHLDEGEELSPPLEAFLAAGPPPVYFGFGSMTDADPAQTTRAIRSCVEALDQRAVISRGWAELGDGVDSARVHVVGPEPHARLFPRLAAVVHHGGAGTVCSAARAGVPQVVVPHLLDQYFWSRRVRQLGLGPAPLERTRLDHDALVAAVSAATSDQAIARRCQELAGALRARDGVREALAHPGLLGP